jgi:hypothetical protein
MSSRSRATIAGAIAFLLAVAVSVGFVLGRGSHDAARAKVSTGTSSRLPTTGVAGGVPTLNPRQLFRSSPDIGGPPKNGTTSFPITDSSPPVASPPPGVPALDCPAPTVTVHNATDLQAALTAAHPGTVILLEDGIYYGRFTASTPGTQDAPIWVCGTRNAIIDDRGDDLGPAPAQNEGHYGLHLANVSWWHLVGFSIRNAQKGVVLDSSSHNILHELVVYNIGDEAIHLRDFSSSNVVEGCLITTTGLRVAKFGEGIYVGTASSNWSVYSNGEPDGSNANVLRYNDITETAAENIDIKEGTSGGSISNNLFDGTGMDPKAATSWVNVKGNDYEIQDNSGHNSVGDGFSTHRIVRGSGEDNVFDGNTIGAGVAGYGFAFHSEPNTLYCNNIGEGQQGQANVSCT